MVREFSVHRREVILGGASLPLAMFGASMETFAAAPDAAASATAFDAGTVAARARDLAAHAYQPPHAALPPWLAKIGYDQYRDYRYRPERALWRKEGLPFQAQFFHRGYMFKERVDMHVVADGRATPLPYSRDLFTYGRAQVPEDRTLGFAGFRLHAPINRSDHFDEVCAFLGASYFRAVAKGQNYGMSARGLALGSGDPGPEEFPGFKAFWLERPARDAKAMVVHALLDSPSAAAALLIAVAPGTETVFDITLRLYPRVELTRAGIAPLTSMFEFDAGDRVGVDDFRPAVHDSDGLALLNGAGEQAWRPLRNHASLQHSGFQDRDPRGYGLMQRKRAFVDYVDIEGAYETRPSVWVEPVGDWGEGEVHLVEIPTADEYHDNIVAFWRPRAPLAAGREYRWRYRLHWCVDHSWRPDIARVASTRSGAASRKDTRLFVVDLAGGRLSRLPADAKPRLQAHASRGELRNAVAYRNPQSGGWVMSFELTPGDATAVELRARLEDGDGPLSETWLYRWTP
jgi:glucans biosynthesis protein